MGEAYVLVSSTSKGEESSNSEGKTRQNDHQIHHRNHYNLLPLQPALRQNHPELPSSASPQCPQYHAYRREDAGPEGCGETCIARPDLQGRERNEPRRGEDEAPRHPDRSGSTFAGAETEGGA